MELYLQFFICLHGVMLNFIYNGLYLNDAYFDLAPKPKYLLKNLHMPESIESLCVCVFRRVPVEWSVWEIRYHSSTQKFCALFETRMLNAVFTVLRHTKRRGEMVSNYASYSGKSCYRISPPRRVFFMGFLSPFRQMLKYDWRLSWGNFCSSPFQFGIYKSWLYSMPYSLSYLTASSNEAQLLMDWMND